MQNESGKNQRDSIRELLKSKLRNISENYFYSIPNLIEKHFNNVLHTHTRAPAQ